MSGDSVDKDNDDGDGTTCNRVNNLGIIENDSQLDCEPNILKRISDCAWKMHRCLSTITLGIES